MVPGVLVGGLNLDGEGPRVDCELGLDVNGVVSVVFTAGISSTVFSSTYFLMPARVMVASNSSLSVAKVVTAASSPLLVTRVSVVTSSLSLVLRVSAATISS
jgi:hypothetical protein